jgi:hypothetical protein
VRDTLHGLRVPHLYGLLKGTEPFGRLLEEHPREFGEKVRVAKLAQACSDGAVETSNPSAAGVTQPG